MSGDRELFLDAARVHFHESGIDGVSLEDFAAEVALDMETVHKHFPEKLALTFTLIKEELYKIAEESMNTIPESPMEEQFKHLIKYRYEFFFEHRISASKVFKEVVVSGEGWRAEYDTMLWRFSVGAVALIQAAKRRGEIQGNADETLAARAIVSYYITGMFMILRGEVEDVQRACDFTFPLIDALSKSLR